MNIRLKILSTCTSFLTVLALFTSCETQEEREEKDWCVFPEFEEMELVWADEFDGPEIDTTKWSFEIGDGCDRPDSLCGWGNNELQYYTRNENNAFINDEGQLVIRAQREIPPIEGREYSSARMISYGSGDWKYGRFDIRAKMPIGTGLWPAIWMLPSDTVYGVWPRSGEIDIMEYLGDKPREVIGTIHWGHDRWRFNTQYFLAEPPDPSFHDEFHLFTCIWTEDCILFQVDGQDIGVPNTRSTTLPSTWPFDQFFHMILNVAVGGNLPGNPTPATTFPQEMIVDYVRVYQVP